MTHCPPLSIVPPVAMGAADEIVTIVDADNRVVGTATRGQMRAQNLPHRSTYILVFTPRGELYVQKRTTTKDVFPGYYDPVAGGVVLAGESYEEAALRELAEEMGIRQTPLTWLFDFYFANEHTRVWGGTFSCVYEGPLVLQAEEVESVTLMTPEEVLRRAEAEPFTPDGLYVVRRYLGKDTEPRKAEHA
ncbi:MAG: NUDIX hydrolase YfcD [Candidatus Binatia bacterium]|nr:NUDIX hydrolase YfcD [Candidatus Binatia bacterium]